MSYDNYFNGGINQAGATYDNMHQWKIRAESLYSDRDVWTPTESRYFPLGAIAESRDGRKWVYCQNGAVALTVARLVQTPTQDAQQVTSTIQTSYGASAGAKYVDVVATTGNAIADSDLIDGWLVVSDGSATAMGHMYKIKDNKQVVSGTDTLIRVWIADQGGLRTAIAATDDCCFLEERHKGVLVTTDTPVGNIIGVSPTAVTASYYFWAQFWGPAPVIVDDADTIVVGDGVMASVDTDTASEGAVALVDASADDFLVGYCMMTGATSETAVINLMLPG
jgi:hypothetical protein